MQVTCTVWQREHNVCVLRLDLNLVAIMFSSEGATPSVNISLILNSERLQRCVTGHLSFGGLYAVDGGAFKMFRSLSR